MNNTPKEIFQAYLDGKVIQVKLGSACNWVDKPSIYEEQYPIFDFNKWRYRIKPEPKKIWVRYYIRLSDLKRTEFPMISNKKDDYTLNCVEPGNNDNYQWISPIIEFHEFMGNQL